MTQRKYYVEFVGPHTAGKTATIQQVVDKDLLAPSHAVYPQQLNRSRFHFMLSVPILAIRNAKHLFFLCMFFYQNAVWRKTNFTDAFQYLFKMIILHPYYARFDFDIWLKDDMLHLLPHIVFKREVSPKVAFRAYFDYFRFLYDGIVYIDVPYETFQQRFTHRFAQDSPQYVAERKRVHEHTFRQREEMRQMLLEQNTVPCLLLSGDANLEENAAKVAAFISTRVLSKDH